MSLIISKLGADGNFWGKLAQMGMVNKQIYFILFYFIFYFKVYFYCDFWIAFSYSNFSSFHLFFIYKKKSIHFYLQPWSCNVIRTWNW
jgi:hypothetical protein